jgi:ABC-2 type transport system permease protein
MLTQVATQPATVSATAAYRAEIRSELLKAFRTPEFAGPTLLLPVMFYALFGLVLARGADAPKYLLATYGIFAALGPALFGFGASIALERDQGLLALKRVAPMPVNAYFLAKLLMSMVFTAAVVLAIYALGALFGGVQLPRGTWLTLMAVHVLATIPFALLGLAIGFSMKGSAALAVCNIVFLLLAVCGGLWMPLEFFPQIMQSIAKALPTYHLAELALLVTGRNREHTATLHLSVIAGYCVLFGALAFAAWRRSEK